MQEDLPELIDAFLEEGAEQLDGLQLAGERGDAVLANRYAHSLGSCSAMLGVLRLARLARGVEAEARAGRLDGVAAAMIAMRTEFGNARPALEALRARSAVSA